MMIQLKFFFLFSVLSSATFHAQSIEEKIAKKACFCIHNTKDFEDVNKLIQKCVIDAKITIEEKIPSKDRKNTVEDIRKTVGDAISILTKYCKAPIVGKMGEQKERLFYQLSKKDSANAYFKIGNEYKTIKKYPAAITAYKKATEIDSHFVIAYDSLASTYQLQNKLKLAITTYERSLQSFPQGSTALLNIASLYFKLKNNEKAGSFYLQLINNHPEKEEGYYGLAKITYIQNKTEEALRNLLNGMRYKNSLSNELKEAEKLLDLIYSKMKNENILSTFHKVTKEYNFTYKK